MSTPGYVLSAAEDPEAGTVDLQILVPPTVHRLYPCAMLDYSRGDKGYDSGGPYIYLRENEFSQSDEPDDVTWFADGDLLRIVDVDAPDPASPLSWVKTAVAVTPGSNRITLNATLASFSTAKRYVVYADDYAALDAGGRTAQKGYTFLADDADRKVQDLIAARKWGGGTPDGTAADPSAAVSLRRPPQLSYTEGEPAPVAFWRAFAEGVNCLKANVCNQHPISDLWSTGRELTGTTYGLVGGPYSVFVPPGATSLIFKVWVSVAAGTGTVRVSAAHSMPGGTVAAPTWGADVVSATGITTATGAPAEVEIILPLTSPALRSLWIGVEAKNSGANTTTVRGVVAYFAPIPLV